MSINKVVYGSDVLIDLSSDTLESANQLAEGIIAHDKAGNRIVGTMVAGGGGAELVVTDDGNGNVVMSYGSATTSDDGNGNVVIE